MEDQDYRTTFELEGHNWWFVGMRRTCLGLLRRSGSPERVLDVGCGTGIILEHLDGVGTAFGLDQSPIALEFCQQRRLGRLVQGKGEQLPFRDGAFTAVTAFGVIEHIEPDEAALREWARVLEPGGQLVLSTSSYAWLWSGHDVSNHHVRRYVTGDLDRLLRRVGLEPEVVSYVNCFLFPPILAVRLLERLVRRGRGFEARKDTGEVPEPVNRLLIRVLALEARLLARRPLPFGVSMVARAVKPLT
ncbi:MAG: type 11 methyltransferase [Acidimicrobiales bacterium]|nr:type 11 methyltransferase [Acidimicrobiales bacterium]